MAAVAPVAALGVALGRQGGSAYGPSYRLVAGGAEPGRPTATATTTTTVAGIAGIDRPFVVGSVQLQVHSVVRANRFNDNVPTDAGNDFVIVTAAVHSGSQEALASERFPVVLTGDPGRKSPSITVTKSASGILNEVAWVFVVPRSTASFALELPGGVVLALDQLLASGPRPIPTTTSTTRPDPDLLVRESFAEPGQWFEGERDGWSVKAGEGTYRVTSSEDAAAGWLSVAPVTGAHPRVKVSVGVTKRSSGRALFGVACRADTEGRPAGHEVAGADRGRVGGGRGRRCRLQPGLSRLLHPPAPTRPRLSRHLRQAVHSAAARSPPLRRRQGRHRLRAVGRLGQSDQAAGVSGE